MFHRWKIIAKYFFKRVHGLFKWIIDYEIVFGSASIILFTPIIIKLLRNIDVRYSMGLLVLSVFIFLLNLVLIIYLRNIREIYRGNLRNYCSVEKFEHFLRATIIFLLAISLILGRAIVIIMGERKTLESIDSFTNQKVEFRGYIADEIEKKHKYQNMEVKQLEDIQVGGEILDERHGIILIKTENYERFSVGQICNFSGVLVEPESFSDFDYKEYLKNKKIFLIMETPSYQCVEVEENREGSFLKNSLVDIKYSVIKIIDKLVPEPQSSLLAGIIFGQKRLFSSSFDENIRTAGVSHITAASGYNITILVLFVNKVLFFLPKKYKIIVGFVVIWMFSILSGLSSSIVRACIMSSISLIALLFGRSNAIHISIPLASAIFVIVDPLIIYDIGFILSISATLGLVYLHPILNTFREKIFKKGKFLDEYVFSTMSCTLSTLPVSIYTFKTLSIWSVPVNVCLLPIIESTMLWGVLYISFFKLFKPISLFFLTVSFCQLKYFQYIVNLVGKLNFGKWEIITGTERVVSFFVIFILILFVLYFYPVKNEKFNFYLK